MVFLQDLVRGRYVGLVHHAVGVQVGEGDSGIAEVVFDGVFIAGRAERRFLMEDPAPAGVVHSCLNNRY